RHAAPGVAQSLAELQGPPAKDPPPGVPPDPPVPPAATQAPEEHVWPGEQLPHACPQTGSAPHSRPAQVGVQLPVSHTPESLQKVPLSQNPQTPPPPSSPQARSPQVGSQEGSEAWTHEKSSV